MLVILLLNAWALGCVVRYMYSAGTLDWSDQELRAMDLETRKRLTLFEGISQE